MDELLTMSKQEISRIEVMQRLKDKRLTQKEAGDQHPAGEAVEADLP